PPEDMQHILTLLNQNN
ncbi:MAG: hypothetical protein ABW100_18590, partial [Candidatus Thiodiazotropha sp. 6PLUC3]